MLLPFEEFQGKGVLDFSSPSSSCSDSSLLDSRKWNNKQGSEPTSVLDIGKSPSPPNSSSTLSSSNGGAAATAVSGNFVGIGNEKCGMGMEDWESVFSGSQENSILRLIMGDVEDPAVNFSKISPESQEMEFNAGFGMVDQGGFPFESFSSGGNFIAGTEPCPNFPPISNPIFSSSPCNPQFQEQLQPLEALDEKPQIFNPQMLINQNQAQFPLNPPMFLQFPFTHLQEHHLSSPPPAKRLSFGAGPPQIPFLASGQELYLRRQQKMVADELASKNLQQAIMDDIFKATELIETRNPALAQGILARLNHQLSPIGKPFQRAAFYFKEALQLLLQNGSLSPNNMVCKICAYKSFSEISPTVQFANFTCNQAILEALVGFEKIHIVDFDIGYGAQWASLMQELVLRRNGGGLKITAFCNSSTYDELELGFTMENLKIFANEINLPFEIDVVKVESLNPGSWQFPLQGSERGGIAVNLPISAFSNHPSMFPSIFRFVKQMSPKIVVSLDRGCDRTDVPFANHVIHSLQSYTGLLESLDAANASIDALQKIEKFLLQPSIERFILGRHKSLERTLPWRSMFMQAGFSPLAFSNFNESQAECLLQRTPVKGFHVEKRQYSLVLCWQRRELVAASAWRC